MSDSEAIRLRDDYLGRLDAEMRDLPHGIADDIRSGIAEELSGLDPNAVRARIAQLGEPAAIASGARESADLSPAEPVSRPPLADTRGYAIFAGFAVGFGAFVVPVLGWFLGILLMWLSPRWLRFEKMIATLVPLAYVIAVMGLLFLGHSGTGELEWGGVNPLAPYDVWNSMLLLVIFLVPATGLWLLWRLRGRG